MLGRTATSVLLVLLTLISAIAVAAPPAGGRSTHSRPARLDPTAPRPPVIDGDPHPSEPSRPSDTGHSREGGRIAPIAANATVEDGVTRVTIRAGNRTVFERTRTDDPPSVSFTSPVPGATLSENATIEWETSDPDGDAVRTTVFVSSDGGRTWHLWRADTAATALDLSRLRIENLSVNLIASDGINTVEATANFTVPATRLNLTVNETAPAVGEPVRFTVAREDTGAPVNATVSVNGSVLRTGPDGVAVKRFDSPGRVTVTATKPATPSVVFLDDTVALSVSAGGAAAYAGADGLVQASELRTAIDDWVRGTITTGLLREVIDAWVRRSPV